MYARVKLGLQMIRVATVYLVFALVLQLNGYTGDVTAPGWLVIAIGQLLCLAAPPEAGRDFLFVSLLALPLSFALPFEVGLAVQWAGVLFFLAFVTRMARLVGRSDLGGLARGWSWILAAAPLGIMAALEAPLGEATAALGMGCFLIMLCAVFSVFGVLGRLALELEAHDQGGTARLALLPLRALFVLRGVPPLHKRRVSQP